jgi:nucleoside 2-deoxyribosyltransferase
MTGRVILLAPMYTEEERWVADEIKKQLGTKKPSFTTYQPYTDGLEGDLFEYLGSATALDAKKAILLSSALNYHYLIQASDACVLVLDGRTPDEGSLFWAAVAFASGKPVVLYKSDYRTFMSTGDNSMVTGLTLNYEPVKKISGLNRRVASHIARYNKNAWKEEHLPGYNKLLLQLGIEVSNRKRTLFDVLRFLKNHKLVETLIPHEVKQWLPPKDITGEKVYCSGPLFCPAEISEMNNIAKHTEGYGIPIYLPHRDGVESMIGDLDNPTYLAEAIKGHMADINSFTIDMYQLVECEHFVINLNGRVPDDGAVSEAGMAFAMALPSALYKSDSRTFFGGDNGFIHPALQMAGHLFDATAEYGEIKEILSKQSRFMETMGNKYSPLIHPEVNKIYTFGKNRYNALLQIYTGKAPATNPFTQWRVAHTLGAPGTWFRFWRIYHPYSKWPGKPGPNKFN